MEWVETTGRTIEEAKEAALDELGVDESDAEFVILEEPKLGLFGRLRAEGRVRARVRPTTPRPKDDRRERRRRSRATSSAGNDAGLPPTTEPLTVPGPDAAQPGRRHQSLRTAEPGTDRQERSRHDHPAARKPGVVTTKPDSTEGDSDMEELALDQQADLAVDFLNGLLESFGAVAAVSATASVEDQTIDVSIDGPNLGLLIGPRGSTLLAVQDLTRTVVQHRAGVRHGRLNLDVAGYRGRRSAALTEFTKKLSTQVLLTGKSISLEPMSPLDRKIVHDAVGPIAGVESHSEGEADQRHVVLSPTEPAI